MLTNRFKRWVRLLAGLHSFWVLVILLLMCLMFTLLTPAGTFLTLNNLKALATDGSELIVLTIGTTFVLIASGLDLSIGSMLVLDTVVTLKLILALGGAEGGVAVLLVASLFAPAFGMAIGVVNGLMIAYLKIPAFIATLGTLGATLGFARLVSGGTNLTGVPVALVNAINDEFLGVPLSVFIAAAVAIIGAVVLHYTSFGLHTYAIGSHTEATRRSGIRINRHLIALYALSGVMVGIVTMVDLGRFGVASINAHTTDNLQAIAGAVIGGTSLFGGRGSILGAVIGAFIPAVLRNGFIIMGLQPFWQEVAVSFVLVAAVYFDQWRRSHLETLQAMLLESGST